MAGAKASLVALLAVFAVVISLAQAQTEAPAPSPDSPAAAISSSLVKGILASTIALVFGSVLRV